MSVKVIERLSGWKDFPSHYVLDCIIVRDNNNIAVFFTIFFENFLNVFDSFSYIKITFPEIFELHELYDLILFFFIGKMDKVVEMLEVKLLVFLIVVFDEPEISLLSEAIEVVFGESFLFMADSFANVRTVLNGFGQQGLHDNIGLVKLFREKLFACLKRSFERGYQNEVNFEIFQFLLGNFTLQIEEGITSYYPLGEIPQSQ